MAMGKIPQGEDLTHSWQVDYTEPMTVPGGLQMGFDEIDIDSGLDFAYMVADANGQSTKKELEQKILYQFGLPGFQIKKHTLQPIMSNNEQRDILLRVIVS